MFSRTTILAALLLSLSALPTHAQEPQDLNRTYVVHNLCPSPINLFIAGDLQATIASGASLKKVFDVFSSFWYTDANGGRLSGVGTTRVGFWDNTYGLLIQDTEEINTGLKIVPRALPKPDGTCTVAECDSASCTGAFVGVLPIFPPNASSPAPFHHCGTGQAEDVNFDVTFCPDGKFPPNSGIQIHPEEDDTKCIEVTGANFASGVPVQVDACNGKQEQNWFLTRGSTTVRAAGTDFCLDAGSNPANGTALTISPCLDNIASQQWNYTLTSQIILQTSNQCVDLADGGVQVQTLECSNSDINQFWTV